MAKKKFKIETKILKIEENWNNYDSEELDLLLNDGWKIKNFGTGCKPSANNYVVFYLQKRVSVED